MPSLVKPLFGLIALALCGLAQADSIVCHITYGGETWLIEAQPVSSPYTVAPTPIGSYFLFRIVFRQEPADLASIKLYTYTNRDTGPVIIHQASYSYPVKSVAPAGDFLQGTDSGFTGLNWVYETVRDSELQYWCELKSGTPK